MPETLQHLENNHLAVTLRDDASALLVDKGTGVPWEMGPVAVQEDGPIDVGHVGLRRERSLCEEYPGRFRAWMEGGRVHFSLMRRARREVGAFTTCEWRLDGHWAVP